jgi:RNA polymerase sigma-70 factor (ECF subfamily)
MDRSPGVEGVTDEHLVARSAGGDRTAFDELVVRHGPYALRVAARLLRDTALAEDVAQEAFVRCWSQIHRFDSRQARFTTWLYRIVVNLCIDNKRRREPEPLPADFDVMDAGATAEEMMESNERATVLAQALKDLPLRQRAALTLIYDEGLSGAEAARVLGSSVKAVERLLARARSYLRARLTSSHFPESDRC